MKRGLILERQQYTNKSIIGSMYYDGDFICYTLERPWLDNEPFFSCVPTGEYTLEPHDYKGRLPVVALVNEELGVTHWDEPGSSRSTILIHPANQVNELAGCIACGTDKGIDEIMNSRDSISLVMSTININNIHSLTII